MTVGTENLSPHFYTSNFGPLGSEEWIEKQQGSEPNQVKIILHSQSLIQRIGQLLASFKPLERLMKWEGKTWENRPQEYTIQEEEYRTAETLTRTKLGKIDNLKTFNALKITIRELSNKVSGVAKSSLPPSSQTQAPTITPAAASLSGQDVKRTSTAPASTSVSPPFYPREVQDAAKMLSHSIENATSLDSNNPNVQTVLKDAQDALKNYNEKKLEKSNAASLLRTYKDSLDGEIRLGMPTAAAASLTNIDAKRTSLTSDREVKPPPLAPQSSMEPSTASSAVASTTAAPARELKNIDTFSAMAIESFIKTLEFLKQDPKTHPEFQELNTKSKELIDNLNNIWVNDTPITKKDINNFRNQVENLRNEFIQLQQSTKSSVPASAPEAAESTISEDEQRAIDDLQQNIKNAKNNLSNDKLNNVIARAEQTLRAFNQRNAISKPKGGWANHLNQLNKELKNLLIPITSSYSFTHSPAAPTAPQAPTPPRVEEEPTSPNARELKLTEWFTEPTPTAAAAQTEKEIDDGRLEELFDKVTFPQGTPTPIPRDLKPPQPTLSSSGAVVGDGTMISFGNADVFQPEPAPQKTFSEAIEEFISSLSSRFREIVSEETSARPTASTSSSAVIRQGDSESVAFNQTMKEVEPLLKDRDAAGILDKMQTIINEAIPGVAIGLHSRNLRQLEEDIQRVINLEKTPEQTQAFGRFLIFYTAFKTLVDLRPATNTLEWNSLESIATAIKRSAPAPLPAPSEAALAPAPASPKAAPPLTREQFVANYDHACTNITRLFGGKDSQTLLDSLLKKLQNTNVDPPEREKFGQQLAALNANIEKFEEVEISIKENIELYKNGYQEEDAYINRQSDYAEHFEGILNDYKKEIIKSNNLDSLNTVLERRIKTLEETKELYKELYGKNIQKLNDVNSAWNVTFDQCKRQIEDLRAQKNPELANELSNYLDSMIEANNRIERDLNLEAAIEAVRRVNASLRKEMKDVEHYKETTSGIKMVMDRSQAFFSKLEKYNPTIAKALFPKKLEELGRKKLGDIPNPELYREEVEQEISKINANPNLAALADRLAEMEALEAQVPRDIEKYSLVGSNLAEELGRSLRDAIDELKYRVPVDEFPRRFKGVVDDLKQKHSRYEESYRNLQAAKAELNDARKAIEEDLIEVFTRGNANKLSSELRSYLDDKMSQLQPDFDANKTPTEMITKLKTIRTSLKTKYGEYANLTHKFSQLKEQMNRVKLDVNLDVNVDRKIEGAVDLEKVRENLEGRRLAILRELGEEPLDLSFKQLEEKAKRLSKEIASLQNDRDQLRQKISLFSQISSEPTPPPSAPTPAPTTPPTTESKEPKQP